MPKGRVSPTKDTIKFVTYLQLRSMKLPMMCQREPALFPLTGEDLPRSANSSDEARVDIAARGFWQRCEKAFFDVRVFNPYASTHRRQTLNSCFNVNEREKKRQYNQRIIEVEHGSFTPVAFQRLWLWWLWKRNTAFPLFSGRKACGKKFFEFCQSC